MLIRGPKPISLAWHLSFLSEEKVGYGVLVSRIWNIYPLPQHSFLGSSFPNVHRRYLVNHLKLPIAEETYGVLTSSADWYLP
jgi:hypothetical protein